MAAHTAHSKDPQILILATESCAYPGANAAGQAHAGYPANTSIIKVKAPVMFPESFYLKCFQAGISGIIVMACGEECPYEGAYPALAQRMDRVVQEMKARELDIRRLKLTSICTVCVRAFLKEVNAMNDIVQELGPPQ